MVHIVVIACSAKVLPCLILSLAAIGPFHLFHPQRWMMHRHMLDPRYACFRLVMLH
jgi:hypothetical protein